MTKEKNIILTDKSNSTDLGYQPQRKIVNDGYQPSETRGFQPTNQIPKPLPNVTSSVQTINPTASTSQNTKNDE